MSPGRSAASETAREGNVDDVGPKSETQRRAEQAFLDFCAHPPPEWLAIEEAYREAEEIYGDDDARALADLEAGRHPLQRRKPASQRP